MKDLSGRVLRERYRIVKKLGEGAMSEVYLGVDPRQAHVRYAIKVLKPNLVHQSALGYRFREESQVLRRLDHPGILRVHDYFEEAGALCMALDFVDGQSLADVLDANGAMDPAVALPMFQVILSALDYAHLAGVIHRDIKPSNILIDREGRPRLCDFGIARQVGQRGITGAGMTLGTPHYMSPEQIQSPQDIDHRADLYSAGVMLYEMLTGKVPFGNAATDSDYLVLQQQVQASPPDPRTLNPNIDEMLCKVLEKALRKDRNRRFQGGSEFWQAIERAIGSGSSSAIHDEQQSQLQPVSQAGVSRRYVVYRHPAGGHVAVKVGFSWPALCLNIVWMFAKALFGHALLWSACWVLLAALLFFTLHAFTDQAQTALVWLIALVALANWLLPGLRGNLWLEDRLDRQGYVRVADLRAASVESAVAAAVDVGL